MLATLVVVVVVVAIDWVNTVPLLHKRSILGVRADLPVFHNLSALRQSTRINRQFLFILSSGKTCIYPGFPVSGFELRKCSCLLKGGLRREEAIIFCLLISSPESCSLFFQQSPCFVYPAGDFQHAYEARRIQQHQSGQGC